MLQVKYSSIAENSLLKTAKFVDSVNTIGAGDRWKERFHKKISRYALPVSYAICRYKIHAKFGYSCIAIDDWIIVFKIENNIFLVKYIVLGTNLK